MIPLVPQSAVKVAITSLVSSEPKVDRTRVLVAFFIRAVGGLTADYLRAYPAKA